MSISKETESVDSLDFTHLDEETETDQWTGQGDGHGQHGLYQQDQDHHNVDMDILQPHLSLPPPPSAAGRRNQRERGVVTVDEGCDGERTVYSSASTDRDSDRPDDGDVVGQSKSATDNNNESGHNNNTFIGQQNGYHHHDESYSSFSSASSPTAAGESSDATTNSTSPDSRSSAISSNSNPIQICYSKNTGNVSVREGQVSTVGQDGTRYIATQQIPQQWDENERKPLKKKRIRWVKIFSIISCILFFPTGIPAAYFAFRVEKEFAEGILRGNIDRAQKFATRSERLCILSVILCILLAALVVTLVERPHFESQHYHRGTVTG